MSGSEQQKAKENAAAIMRAKQLAGTSLQFHFTPACPISRLCERIYESRDLWVVLISRAAEAKKAEGAAKK